MSRTLLAMTTANQVAFTRAAIDSIKVGEDHPGFDLLIIDDASVDGTVEYCKANAIRYISKSAPKGLIDSWNLAYREFVFGAYDYLVLANNDILVPRGALREVLAVAEQHVIVGVMSTRKGVGHQPLQALRQHYRLKINENRAANYQEIQDEILKMPAESPWKQLSFINGFFFCLNRNIRRYELPGGQLFDPRNVNLHGEADLCGRVLEPKVLCTRAFVFHFKGVSFHRLHFRNKWLIDREMTWQELGYDNMSVFQKATLYARFPRILSSRMKKRLRVRSKSA